MLGAVGAFRASVQLHRVSEGTVLAQGAVATKSDASELLVAEVQFDRHGNYDNFAAARLLQATARAAIGTAVAGGGSVEKANMSSLEAAAIREVEHFRRFEGSAVAVTDSVVATNAVLTAGAALAALFPTDIAHSSTDGSVMEAIDEFRNAARSACSMAESGVDKEAILRGAAIAAETTGAFANLCALAAGGVTSAHPSVRAAACGALLALSPALVRGASSNVPLALDAIASALQDLLPLLESTAADIGSVAGPWAGDEGRRALAALRRADRLLQDDADECSDDECAGDMLCSSPYVSAAVLSASRVASGASLGFALEADDGEMCEEDMDGTGGRGEFEREGTSSWVATARTAALCCAGAILQLQAASDVSKGLGLELGLGMEMGIGLDVGRGKQPAGDVVVRVMAAASSEA